MPIYYDELAGKLVTFKFAMDNPINDYQYTADELKAYQVAADELNALKLRKTPIDNATKT